MLSLPQLEDAVKTLPAPIHLKEQILDAVLGQHDALHGPDRKPRAVRPLIERTAEARKVGAFDFLRTEPSGDEVYAYCKLGVRSYEVVVRDGRAVLCGCRNFEIEVARQPDYRCKHIDLYDTTSKKLEELEADACAKAAEFMALKIRRRYGRATDGEVRAALTAVNEAETRASWFAPEAGTGDTPRRRPTRPRPWPPTIWRWPARPEKRRDDKKAVASAQRGHGGTRSWRLRHDFTT